MYVFIELNNSLTEVLQMDMWKYVHCSRIYISKEVFIEFIIKEIYK